MPVTLYSHVPPNHGDQRAIRSDRRGDGYGNRLSKPKSKSIWAVTVVTSQFRSRGGKLSRQRLLQVTHNLSWVAEGGASYRLPILMLLQSPLNALQTNVVPLACPHFPTRRYSRC
jgi:hypothetical protein